MNQEFILCYLLPGLVVWLVSFRWKDPSFGSRFALFCFAWPFGLLLMIVMALAVFCEDHLADPWRRLEKLLMTDIFKGKDND